MCAPEPNALATGNAESSVAAAGLQFVQHRKVELGIGSVQPPAHDLAPLAHASDRVHRVREQIAQLMSDHDLLGLPGSSPP